MKVAKESSFDPNKSYTWTPESKFELSGEEFGIILNGLRAILSSQEAQKVLIADRAHTAIEKVLGKAVESGIAIETTNNQ
jgi:hypothetical protein